MVLHWQQNLVFAHNASICELLPVAGGDFWACATTPCRTRIGTPCQLWYLPESSKIPFEGCSSYSADLSKVAEFGAIDVTIFWPTGRQDSKSKPTKYVCFFALKLSSFFWSSHRLFVVGRFNLSRLNPLSPIPLSWIGVRENHGKSSITIGLKTKSLQVVPGKPKLTQKNMLPYHQLDSKIWWTNSSCSFLCQCSSQRFSQTNFSDQKLYQKISLFV